jgi:hypothetical protein
VAGAVEMGVIRPPERGRSSAVEDPVEPEAFLASHPYVEWERAGSTAPPEFSETVWERPSVAPRHNRAAALCRLVELVYRIRVLALT